MQDDPTSHGLWELTAPHAPQTGRLAGEIDVDILVIGGGYTGLSSALHLAEGGARVAVLEASEIGFGGSGRNVGLVNAGMWVMPDTLVATLGQTHGERLIDLLGRGPRRVFDLIAQHGIECEQEPTGTLHCAVGRRGLEEIEARAEQWQRRGAPVEILDAEETRRRSVVATTPVHCWINALAQFSRWPMFVVWLVPRLLRARKYSLRVPLSPPATSARAGRSIRQPDLCVQIG